MMNVPGFESVPEIRGQLPLQRGGTSTVSDVRSATPNWSSLTWRARCCS